MNHMVRTGIGTPLLSLGAKLRVSRLAFDVAVAKVRGRLDYADMAKSAPLDTESARGYALRALGAELHSYLCEPIVRTMLIADTDKVSKVDFSPGSPTSSPHRFRPSWAGRLGWWMLLLGN